MIPRGLVRILDEEVPVLQNLAKEVPEDGTIVEIGSAFGFSICKMAEVCRESVTLHAIDPWSLIDQGAQRRREALFDLAILRFDNIKKIKAFSQDVEWNEEIDLLFIDGNHFHPHVDNDYLKFSPFVKRGGFLVFHDYKEERVPDVAEVVDELAIPSNLWEWEVKHSMWIGIRK